MLVEAATVPVKLKFHFPEAAVRVEVAIVKPEAEISVVVVELKSN
jgi:hypothetical protein